jgi:hypothetical protein
MDRLEKELITLKERISTKKDVFKQEKEITLELVRDAKKVLKKEVGKDRKPEKEQKPENEKPEKEQKKNKKQKTVKDIEKQNPEIVEIVEEPK